MMPLRLLHPRHLLTTLIFVGVLMLGVRVTDMWDSLSTGRVFDVVTPSAASDKTGPDVTPPSLTPASQTTPDNKEGKADTGGDKQATAALPAAMSIQPDLKNITDVKPGEDASGAEMALIKQLTERRDQLDQRARDMDSREALIKVAEQRVDQKIKEMEILRAQLQTMVSQADAEQQTQIENLVKIYETMKPKEAARIFEALDMPVLLGVVQRMKPQRTAAVMAEMAPEKAKEITVALTKKDQLPQIK